MKSALWATFAAVLLLAGCAIQPATRWYKQGANQQAYEADNSRCRVYAYNAVAAYQPPQTPTTQYRSSCAGNRYNMDCETTAVDGGNNAPIGAGATYGWMQGQDMARADNARNAAYSSCMYDRGWQLRTQESSRNTPVVAKCPADCGVVSEVRTSSRDGATIYQVITSMEDGKKRTFSYSKESSYRVGDRIVIVEGKLRRQ